LGNGAADPRWLETGGTSAVPMNAKFVDGSVTMIETLCGRRLLNRLGAFLYWRSRGENLDDPERNGEYRTLRLLGRSVLGHAPLAFDVGANLGEWSGLFVRETNEGRVCAFEPVEETFRALQKRFLPESRVECCNTAMSDCAGECGMVVGEIFSGSNSIHQVWVEGATRTQSVPATTGDEFVDNRKFAGVDFVKIDVEGHEVSVLRGFRRSIAERRIRFIQWEYNKTWIAARTSLREAFELLTPAGYRLFKIRPGDLLHYDRYHPSLDNYCYSNWLAVGERDLPQVRSLFTIDEGAGSDW
jgi:FkbM family methyltransferase